MADVCFITRVLDTTYVFEMWLTLMIIIDDFNYLFAYVRRLVYSHHNSAYSTDVTYTRRIL
jgi:hypothetical protein